MLTRPLTRPLVRPLTRRVTDAIFASRLGPELVANRSFDTSTGWTAGGTWAIGSGVATHTVGAGASDNLDYLLPVPLTLGKSYQVVFDLSGRTAGEVRPILTGGANAVGAYVSTNGTERSQIITATASHTTLRFNCSQLFDGSIDNVSLREVRVP